MKRRPPSTLINLAGKTIGRLVVLHRAEDDSRGQARWCVRCSCGVEKVVHGQQLRNGQTRSCGCLSRELTKARATKHGFTPKDPKKHHPLYSIWNMMLQRCHNKRNQRYSLYGARGISVHECWRKSFVSFLNDVLAEIGPRPLGHSLDRKDNDGAYAPGNIKWSTQLEQMRNTRACKKYVVNGVAKFSWEWAVELGVSASTVRRRYTSTESGSTS